MEVTIDTEKIIDVAEDDTSINEITVNVIRDNMINTEDINGAKSTNKVGSIIKRGNTNAKSTKTEDLVIIASEAPEINSPNAKGSC